MGASSTDDALRDYLQWLAIEKGRSLATLEAYERDIRAFLTETVATDVAITEITGTDIENYLVALREQGRATSSIARATAALRGLFAYLDAEGQLTGNPTANVRTSPRGRTLPKPLDEAVLAALLDGISMVSSIERRDRALLEFLYGTGARVSEVVGVRLGDLDFDEELILLTGKGNKQRLVPMGETLRTSLRSYLEIGGRDELLGRQRHDRLFVNVRGGPLSRQGVDLIIERRALVAGIDRRTISAHVFRHSCATHMLAHGADIRVVQELLGHVSIATTQLYTAVSIASLQRDYLNAHPRAVE